MDKEFEKAFKEQLDALSIVITKSADDSEGAKRTAEYVMCRSLSRSTIDIVLVCSTLALELTRIRRLMQAAGGANEAPPENKKT